VGRVVELGSLGRVKPTLLDFDTYNGLDWSRYAIQVTESFTEEQARSEYYDRLDELIAALERLGSHNPFGEGDFATGSDWYGPHRSLSFEITSDRLLTPNLVPTIQALIQSFPHPYMVSVGYDPFLNGSTHGLSSGDFYATIEADSVTITVHNELVLSLLGLRDAANAG
jgi:hypothetical protein